MATLSASADTAADTAGTSMTWAQTIILSVVRGLTGFPPVSSSGHLRVVSELLWGQDAGAFLTVVVQPSTELAMLAFFAKDIWQILTGWFAGLLNKEARDFNYRMGWVVVAGTLPIVIIGVLGKDLIRDNLHNLWITAAVLVFFSFASIAAEKFGRRERNYEELTMRDAIAMGFAQCLALIPGVSRSGGTVSASLFLHLDREVATRFSFLLAIPAVFAAGIFSPPDAFDPAVGQTVSGAQLAIGMLIAFIVGYASIAWLLKFVSDHSFAWFAAYRIPVGLIVMVLFGFGMINAA